MQSRGRTLRFAVVSASVVLCLTGFTTGRGHGHGHHGGSGGSSSGGGGGCSSSSQDHDSSSSSSGGGVYKDDGQGDSYGGSGSNRDRYDGDNDDSYGSGSGSGTSEPDSQNVMVKLLSCATKKKPYATVEVTSLNATTEGRFAVTVSFRDARGIKIVSAVEEADVPANGKVTVRVPVPGRDRIARVDHCDLDPEAPAMR
ncbi:hypothetical protein C1I97_35655 [Streptomyces sp. NTH33]|uniref:hypothetical protein n=1 Tax=Streptomyces sp. NTH33 TaxID=1735453 RepID=UPI000DA79DF7|nr:hypothetical protein [Streptomyces sp. NTH33]PZG81731.1 hypothetical protein C1I97_35655 [Streptomyces sp. NTH33]